MRGKLITMIDRLFGIAGTSPDDIVLLEERLSTLQPRMPWIYLLLVSAPIGLVLAFRPQGKALLIIIILCSLIAFRGLFVFRVRRQKLVGEAARNRLRNIATGTFIAITMFAIAINQILPTLTPGKWQLMMLMTSACTIAMATPMAVLPVTTRSFYLLLGIPTAFSGIMAGPDPAVSVALFNLLLCNVILTTLLQLQDRSFVDQVMTKLENARARHRAELAEQRAVEERRQARSAAESDFLTGLPNRRAFLAAISKREAAAVPDTLMILDLDGFKPVNDTFGHAVGDELLKQVSQRLFVLTHGDTLVARLGGDEFAMLVRGVDRAGAHRFAGEVVAKLGEPYCIGTSIIGIAACLGMAVLDVDSTDPSDAIREADLALYRAKALGRGKVEQYDCGLGEAVKRRGAIEQALREPNVEEEIELAYQPIYDLKTMRIAAFEALARWSHSRLGPVSPADFIPITEQIQLVETLTESLLSRAIGHASCWIGGQRLSFNLSAVQLCSIGSAARVLDIVDATGFAHERLQIEVTETAMMGDLVAARDNLAALRTAGVKVVLDDFGAGFASIGYLREMRFDKLKLDGSLLAACATSDGTALLKGVISLARAIGTPCIAEHVETMQQATLLRTLGCRYGQGYWLGKPVCAAEAEALSRAETMQGRPTLRMAG